MTIPEELEYRYLKQKQKQQLQHKPLESLKGRNTNPDISQLRGSTESGAQCPAHLESNPLSRKSKVILTIKNERINHHHIPSWEI
jgi:hypothetical protein